MYERLSKKPKQNKTKQNQKQKKQEKKHINSVVAWPCLGVDITTDEFPLASGFLLILGRAVPVITNH